MLDGVGLGLDLVLGHRGLEVLLLLDVVKRLQRLHRHDRVLLHVVRTAKMDKKYKLANKGIDKLANLCMSEVDPSKILRVHSHGR